LPTARSMPSSHPGPTAGLRPTIIDSWRRSLAAGLDPTDLRVPIEVDQSEARDRWLMHPIGSLAYVLEVQLRAWAEESQSLVVVTDASGLLLNVDGAEWLKERAREMNFLEGALFSEAVVPPSLRARHQGGVGNPKLLAPSRWRCGRDRTS